MGCGRWSVDGGVWTVECGRWGVDSECEMVRCRWWTVDGGVWTVECGWWGVDGEVWTVSVDGEVWTVGCEPWGVDPGVWTLGCGRWGVDGASVHRFSRQEYWGGLSFPPPGDLPDPGIESTSPESAERFFTTEPPRKPIYKHYHTLFHEFIQ